MDGVVKKGKREKEKRKEKNKIKNWTEKVLLQQRRTNGWFCKRIRINKPSLCRSRNIIAFAVNLVYVQQLSFIPLPFVHALLLPALLLLALYLLLDRWYSLLAQPS